jgi:DNA polymerase III subunit delta'
MTFPSYFNSKKSLNLYDLSENFIFLKNLYVNNKLPNAIILSGKKGSGKSTLINHLMFFIFDNHNYNEKNNELKENSLFLNQFLNNTFSNIIILQGSDYKNSKIEDVRILKKKIFQTTISDKPRFIILDDVELFNNNSLNALLKIIEEPTRNNYFVLINNNTKTLLETVKSRCIELKVILNEKKRNNIIQSLIKKFKIELTINYNNSHLTPGNFIKFNYVYEKNKIDVDGDFLKNLTILINLYKKDKDLMYIEIISFLTDSHFNNLSKKNTFTNEKIMEFKKFVFENINNFFLYNLNQNAVINNISAKMNDE